MKITVVFVLNCAGDLQVDSAVVSSTSASTPTPSKGGKKCVGDNKLKLLAEERQRLEKENEEKKRRLENLRKQEMLIEEAATKGGLSSAPMSNVYIYSVKKYI